MRRPEESRRTRIAPGIMTAFRREPDEGRAGLINSTLKFGHGSADARPPTGRGVRARRSACEAHHRIVRTFGSDERADESELVRHFRHERKLFTDLNAGNIGSYRPELAAELGRSIGLEIPHVLMRGPARKENHDNRLVINPACHLSTCRLGREDLRQTRPAQSEATDLKEGTTGKAVAEFTGLVAEDGEHSRGGDRDSHPRVE